MLYRLTWIRRTAGAMGMVLMLVFVSAAQDRPRTEDGPPESRGEGAGGRLVELFDRLPLIAVLDVDGDGVISAEEIQNAPAALKKLDTDGDGKLSRDEWMPLPRLLQEAAPLLRRAGLGQPGQFMERLIQQADANGDGKLTREELPERMRNALSGRFANAFDAADQNKDGALDREELQAFLGRLPLPGFRGGARPDSPQPDAARPRSARPQGDRPQGDRPRDGRPREDRPREDRPPSDRPERGRAQGDRPQGDQP